MNESHSDKKKKSKTSLEEAEKIVKKCSKTKIDNKDINPCTSASANINTEDPLKLNKKSSKTKISDVSDDEPLDLSTKKQRTQSDPLQRSPFNEFNRSIMKRIKTSETNFKGAIITPFFKVPPSERPWGSLYFYENQKLVLSYDLWNYQPIKITGQTILGLKESQDNEKNVVMNYNDWQHVIGKGFTLRKGTDDKSLVEMQRLDDSPHANKYKVIIGTNEIKIESNEVYHIYDGNEYEKNLKDVNDLSTAHEFVQSCYALIGIHGQFMRSFPLPLTFDSINKEIMSNLPYWFVLKFNTEYALLDKHICAKISNKEFP